MLGWLVPALAATIYRKSPASLPGFSSKRVQAVAVAIS